MYYVYMEYDCCDLSGTYKCQTLREVNTMLGIAAKYGITANWWGW